MKLENEIQQQKFKSIQQKLMVNLIYTTNWINAKHDVKNYLKGLKLETIEGAWMLPLLKKDYNFLSR